MVKIFLLEYLYNLSDKEILQEVKGKDTNRIVVITNDFYKFRAELLAKRVGFESYGISCSTPVSVKVNCYIREFFALIKSFLMDR